MEAIFFVVCQAGTLRHDVAKWVLCRNIRLKLSRRKLYDTMSLWFQDRIWLAVWGVINLLEGYGNDNPDANTHVR